MLYDLVLVGGGLSNGLIAYRLAMTRPDLRIALLEADVRVGGNHTWSFHETDLTPAQNEWIAPLVGHSWPAHEVRFGDARRRLSGGYRSIPSDRFAAALETLSPVEIVTGTRIVELRPDGVSIEGGDGFEAAAVVDGRGAIDSPDLTLGFQKFLGQEVRLAEPHGLDHPILMDGTVEQIDGFRFVYVLPLDEESLLIEDTYYADGGDFDPVDLRARIADYAAGSGWRIEAVEREESGVLPIALAGNIDAFWEAGHRRIARAGMRAALFHPTTGYSLPDAVRLADAIAAAPDLAADPLAALTRKLSQDLWRRRGFYRLLNRMLFLAAAPSQRIDVMARFYRLPEPLIARFYAGTTTLADKARILAGRPPVKISRALRALPPAAARKARP